MQSPCPFRSYWQYLCPTQTTLWVSTAIPHHCKYPGMWESICPHDAVLGLNVPFLESSSVMRWRGSDTSQNKTFLWQVWKKERVDTKVSNVVRGEALHTCNFANNWDHYTCLAISLTDLQTKETIGRIGLVHHQINFIQQKKWLHSMGGHSFGLTPMRALMSASIDPVTGFDCWGSRSHWQSLRPGSEERDTLQIGTGLYQIRDQVCPNIFNLKELLNSQQ